MDGNTMPNTNGPKKSNLKLEGEGSYEGARAYRKGQEEFAQSGRVEKKAREAADALDSEEGKELERARRSSKSGPKH